MYTIHPMTIMAARDMASWRYASPYDIYSIANDAEATVEFYLDPVNRYAVVRDRENRLIGYCCFGADARVPGGDYNDERARWTLALACGLH